MGKKKDGIPAVLRRELVRFALERYQGASLKRDMDIVDNDDVMKDLPYEVEEMLNRPYMNRQEVPLAMDIFKPKTEEGKELPVIVTIHGGGLVLGDRKMHRNYARILAGHGYLVFTIEYRLAPRANSAEQLDDVCAGLDLVGRELVNFDVDFSRVFLTAESAGAYLAVYVAAMKRSIALQKAIGYEPSKVRFRALGLICGMFYTQKRDPIGLLLAEQFFGDKNTNEKFIKYMDPEDPEIIDNLPPVFLVTSRGDFLNNYTLLFHKALKKAGNDTHLVYYGEEELKHAFVTMRPTLEQSMDAIRRMLDYFEAEAEKESAGKSSRKESVTETKETEAAAEETAGTEEATEEAIVEVPAEEIPEPVKPPVKRRTAKAASEEATGTEAVMAEAAVTEMTEDVSEPAEPAVKKRTRKTAAKTDSKTTKASTAGSQETKEETTPKRGRRKKHEI